MIFKIINSCLLSLLLHSSTPDHHDYSCSAFIINSDGYMATAGHCIGAKYLVVEYKKTFYNAHLIALDSLNDIAIIKAKLPTKDHYQINVITYITERVTLIGFPIPDYLGYYPHHSYGFISGHEFGALSYKLVSYHGDSGAPVINDHNQVVGMLNGGLDSPEYHNLGSINSYGTPIQALVDLANKYDIKLDFGLSQVFNILKFGDKNVVLLLGEY